MFRDFTFVDDIVEGIIRVIDKPAKPNPDWDNLNPDPATSSAPYRVFNIGNSQPIKLMDFISAIENEIGREAIKEFMPMQPGDVLGTFSDSSALYQNFNFKPSHGLADGIKKTVSWFKAYYNL
jgi:UDP-glucuronate 4-epimerase